MTAYERRKGKRQRNEKGQEGKEEVTGRRTDRDEKHPPPGDAGGLFLLPFVCCFAV